VRIVKSLTFCPHRRRRQRGEPSRRIRLRPGGSTPARRLHMQKLVRSRQNLHCAAHVCFSGPCGGVQRPRSALSLRASAQAKQHLCVGVNLENTVEPRKQQNIL